MKPDLRDEQREYVEKILDRLNISLTELAKRAGISHPTLTQFMNKPERSTNLSATTMAKIEKVARNLPGLRAPSLRRGKVQTVPVVGVAAFGVWRETRKLSLVSDSYIPVVFDTSDARGDRYAYRMDDDSIDKEVGPGGYVIIQAESDYVPEPGKLVHVKCRDGNKVEDTIRRVERNEFGFWLTAYSRNSIYDDDKIALDGPGFEIVGVVVGIYRAM